MAKSVWEIPGAIDELKKLRAEGLSASRIADALTFKFNQRVTRSGVCGKADRLDLGLSSKEAQRFASRQMARKRAKAKAASKASPTLKPIPPLRRALEMAPEPMPFVIVEEVIVPEKERVGIEGLGPHQCKWPIGEPGKPDFHFCHHKRIGGISYCEIHARRAYRPIEQQPREIRRSFANDNVSRSPARVKEDA